MVREIKQQIRTLVRKNLEIPEFVPIKGCDVISRSCETEASKRVIESNQTPPARENITVRSIEINAKEMGPEPEYCSVGPEYHNLTGVVAEEYSNEIREDINRKKRVMYVYSIAIVSALILTVVIFSSNTQIPDSIVPVYGNFGLLVAGLVLPLIFSGFIHLTVAQRVKTDILMYWLPVFILVSLFGTWWMSSTDKDGFARVFAVIGVVGVIASTLGISFKHITMFNECHPYQTMMKSPPREVSAGFAVSVVVILLLSFFNGWIISSV